MRGLAARYAAFDMTEAVRTLFALLLLGLASVVFPHPLRAATFSGGYDGIGDAAGMSLTLSQIERRVVGSLSFQGGAVYTLNGEREDIQSGAAQGALSARGGQHDAFFHIEERPLGLQLLFIPATAEGEPDLGRASEYSFLKRGVRPTLTGEASPRYKVAPDEPVDILAFIDGFRGWSPADTARLYAGLPERQRALILLYDHATAELMWRICEAAPEEGSIAARRLAELQERQQTDCEAYLRAVERAKKGGLFPEFLRRSQFQLELVRATVLCDRGETGPARCADVSALGSPLILRWRRADAIMREIAGPDAEPDGRENEQETETAAEHEAEETSPGPVAEAENVPPVVSGAPLPLPRPVEGKETVLDFEPDASPIAAETVERHRLPLARP